MKQAKSKLTYLAAAFGIAILFFENLAVAAEPKGQFEEYEIRVIRPRYFNKKQRFELGAQLAVIMNESFVYTYLATGLMTFHFSESIAFEGSGAYGLSFDKEDKRILQKEFDIRTQIFRTQYAMEGAVLWTPAYGKWQLPSGRLIYFDTFLAAGGGMTGIQWKYSDFCTPPIEGVQGPPIPSDTTISYPTFMAGLGQRFFINKATSLRADLRWHTLFYDTGDAACDQESAESSNDLHHNITMQLGASKFF